MRFMVMLKANKDTEAGKLPSEKMLAEMGFPDASRRQVANPP